MSGGRGFIHNGIQIDILRVRPSCYLYVLRLTSSGQAKVTKLIAQLAFVLYITFSCFCHVGFSPIDGHFSDLLGNLYYYLCWFYFIIFVPL